MHQHQMRALTDELRKPLYDDLSADDVYKILHTPFTYREEKQNEDGTKDHAVVGVHPIFSLQWPRLTFKKVRNSDGKIVDVPENVVFPPEHNPEKSRSAVVKPASEVPEWAAACNAFPGGSMPGMPNKIRREFFDAAWKEAGR